MRLPSSVATTLAGSLLAAGTAHAAWPGYGGNAQHTALATAATQPLQQVHWQAPVDLKPQYSGSVLFIHYGSPLVTAGNTVIFPVKLGTVDTFRVEARRASDGAVLWQLPTDYQLPPHNWTPSMGPVLTPAGRLYTPGAGGTLLWTSALDTPGPHTATRVAFYGDAAYAADPATWNTSLKVCTPLTSGANGTVYFGVRAVNANPLGISSGVASVDSNGVGHFEAVGAASGGLAVFVGMNCAPALSADEATLYIGARASSSSPGYLLALGSSDLRPLRIASLFDPASGSASPVTGDATSSPMVAPDGRIFFGVLENPFGSNADRGWLLQLSSALAPSGAPGAFGWDDTPSLVPASLVPGYTGSSSYLLMTKYNFYAGLGGDGRNRIAIVDPGATQADPYSGVTVMKEVLTILGPTPDPSPSFPNAVDEWCINTAVVDPFTHSVIAGSEDGILYRWDLATNTFTEQVVLTTGIGEAYTPTLSGPDGQVYAINNATLFAVGATNGAAPPPAPVPGVELAAARPNPSGGTFTLSYRLGESTDARLEILDVGGRQVALLADGPASAGEHTARWNAAAARPAGVYFARLTAAGTRRIVKLALVR